MALMGKSGANVPEDSIEIVKENVNTEHTDLFGFEAEYTEVEGYTTISGKEQKELTNATKYDIGDFELNNVVTGYPEVTIFNNNEKDDQGEFKRNYQSVRLRVIDGEEEYIDLYANIPRRDEKGFIENLNHYYDFFRGGFDLVFSFMRWIDETKVYDENGETINRIKMVNIENVCKKIDQMEYVKVKIIAGASEQYPSWIIIDMKEEI